MSMRFLYPNSLLNPKAVDEFFADEAAAVDGPRVALWDAAEGRLLERQLPVAGETLAYRGWILTKDGYRRLADAIEAKGATPWVSAEGYARSQFLDGWIDTMEGLTPRSVVAALDVSDDRLAALVAERLPEGRYVVKGLSKSAKDDWANAMYISSPADLPRVVGNLRERISSEEDSLVVREFVPLMADELRLWWVDGECVQTRNHPQSRPDVLDTTGLDGFVRALRERVAELGVPFVTTDVTRDQDGRWWLVEVGSGCVSEMPAGMGVDGLFAAR